MLDLCHFRSPNGGLSYPFCHLFVFSVMTSCILLLLSLIIIFHQELYCIYDVKVPILPITSCIYKIAPFSPLQSLIYLFIWKTESQKSDSAAVWTLCSWS